MNFFVLFFALALSGCISLFPAPPPQPKSIPFTPEMGAPSFPRGAAPWSLTIEPFLASEPFDSKRLIVNVENEKGLRILEPLAEVEWNDRFPVLLQQRLISAFETSNTLTGVGEENETFKADFSLQGVLKRAEIVLRGADQQEVQVDVSVRLISKKDRHVIGQRSFKITFPATERTQKALIKTYERAFGRVMTEILLWTLKEGEKAYARIARSHFVQ